MTDTFCGCKGVRTCSLCAAEKKTPDIRQKHFVPNQETYIFCPLCRMCHPLQFCAFDASLNETEPLVNRICHMYREVASRGVCATSCSNDGSQLKVGGIHVEAKFIPSPEIESEILRQIEAFNWKASQSGRLKQVSVFVAFDSALQLCCSDMY